MKIQPSRFWVRSHSHSVLRSGLAIFIHLNSPSNSIRNYALVSRPTFEGALSLTLYKVLTLHTSLSVYFLFTDFFFFFLFPKYYLDNIAVG